jgi:hypothetical protein
MSHPWPSAGPPPSPGSRRRRTVGLALISVLVVAVLAAGTIAGIVVTNRVRSVVADRRHIAPIAIPPSLYDTAPRASASLVTPVLAARVAASMWSLRQTALWQGNSDAIRQLDVPGGPLVASDLTACGCSSENVPTTYSSLVTLVQTQNSYPLDFMAEYQSAIQLQSSFGGGRTYPGPWEVIEVLTKADAGSAWRVAFATGFSNAKASANVVPFRPPPGAGAYDDVATIQPPVAVGQLPGLLAAYWQSFKDMGQAPPHTVFLPGSDTSEFGAYIAQTPQGTLLAGTHSKVTFAYSADPARDGIWSFPVQPGDDLVTCSTVQVVATYVPVGASSLVQGSGRIFGAGLAPGRYAEIEDTTIHESCIVTASNGLAVFGTDGFDTSDVGLSSRRA